MTSSDPADKKRAVGILRPLYHGPDTTDYGNQRAQEEYGCFAIKTDVLTDEEWAIVREADLVPNTFERASHDELVHRLLRLQDDSRLTQRFVTTLYLKGIGGEGRFRQPLMSYAFLQDVAPHDFGPDEDGGLGPDICRCGLPRDAGYDRTQKLLTFYLGHSWNEFPVSFPIDLEEVLRYPEPERDDEDLARLGALLASIDGASDEETPGRLAQRIGREKLLPHTDRYQRYGILQALACWGVLPSRPDLDRQPARSDIAPPLAGWRGGLGVDFARAEALFAVELR